MTMANPNLIVRWSADKPLADPFSDEVEAVRMQWRKNQAGIEVLKSWLSLGNGTLVDVCGTDGVLELVPSALDEMKGVVDQYIQTTGFTLSVGIGGDMADAERARRVAKHRGGDRMMLWSDELYPELAVAQEREDDGEYDEYGESLNRNESLADIWTDEDFVELAKMTRQPYDQLMKSDFTPDEMNALESPQTPMSGGASAPAYARAGSPPEQAASGASPGGGDVPPDAQTASQAPENNIQGQPTAGEEGTHEDAFHAHAQAADADDQASQSPQRQQIKQAVVQVLKQVAPQLKQLDAIKDQVPDAYEGVLAVVQAMAAMAQALNGEEPAVPKEEGGEGEGKEKPKEEKTEKSEGRLEKTAPRTKQPGKMAPDPLIVAKQIATRFHRWYADHPVFGSWGADARSGAKHIAPDCQHIATCSALALEKLGHKVQVVGGTAVGDDAPEGSNGGGIHYWLKVNGHHFDPKAHVLNIGYSHYKPEWEWTPQEAANESVEDPDEPIPHLLRSSSLNLEKDAVIPAKRAGIHHHLNLPVGSEHNGEIKTLNPTTGKSSWKSVRAGIVQSPTGTPTSSRNPNGQ